MGCFVDDHYEANVIVQRSPEEVWSSLEKQENGELAWLSAWPRMPGDESAGTVLSVEPLQCIRVHKDSEPCKDTEIILTLVPGENGTTRVQVIQKNLPPWVMASIDAFVLGGDQIVADLVLFLERDVLVYRHAMNWSFLGIVAREVTAGLEVTALVPGTYGNRVGMEVADLIIALGGAPVFTQQCLQAVSRVFKSGDEIEATWLRGQALQHGKAAI